MPATLRHELARKAIHLASATVPIAYAAGAPRAGVIGALAAAGVTAAGVEVARVRSPRVREVFDRAVGRLLRPHERGHWSGATWMCAAYLLAVLLFPRREAVAGMLAVALGDGMAAVVGRLAGRLRAGRRHAGQLQPAPAVDGGKTWAGSVACWGATTLGALLIARTGVVAAVVCGMAAALAERPRWALDDNVRVALTAAAAAWGATYAAAYIAAYVAA